MTPSPYFMPSGYISERFLVGRPVNAEDPVTLERNGATAGAGPLYRYRRCRHGARVLPVDLRYRRVAALQHRYRQPPRERSIIVSIAG